MARLLLCVLVVLFVVYESEAKIYDRCSLAKELKTKRIPQDQIDNFVCLVEHNSYNTEWVGGPYKDGTKNFGIFQISNNDWCVLGAKGGLCDLDCNSLIDDDITDDLVCAKEVHVRYGFDPWWVWGSNCRPAGPDVSDCYTEVNSTADASASSGKGSTETSVKDGTSESVVVADVSTEGSTKDVSTEASIKDGSTSSSDTKTSA